MSKTDPNDPARQTLEVAVKLAVLDLMDYLDSGNFILEMPAGDEIGDTHFVVVGTAAEATWLLDKTTANLPAGQELARPGGDRRH